VIGLVGGSATAGAWSRAGLPIEILLVPSPSMGGDIEVEYQGGGRHAVYLLYGLRARDDFNGWNIDTQAFEWLYQSGLSVVMPVGGMSSFYSDWYKPAEGIHGVRTYKWDTYIPDHRAAPVAGFPEERPQHRQRRGRRLHVRQLSDDPGRVSPKQFVYAASLSAFLNPSANPWPGTIGLEMDDAGGFTANAMWGPRGTTRRCRCRSWSRTAPGSGSTAAPEPPASWAVTTWR